MFGIRGSFFGEGLKGVKVSPGCLGMLFVSLSVRGAGGEGPLLGEPCPFGQVAVVVSFGGRWLVESYSQCLVRCLSSFSPPYSRQSQKEHLSSWASSHQ